MPKIIIKLRVIKESEGYFETQIKTEKGWEMFSATRQGMHVDADNVKIIDFDLHCNIAEAANQVISEKLRAIYHEKNSNTIDKQ